jgi:hypothetical protein
MVLWISFLDNAIDVELLSCRYFFFFWQCLNRHGILLDSQLLVGIFVVLSTQIGLQFYNTTSIDQFVLLSNFFSWLWKRLKFALFKQSTINMVLFLNFNVR